MVRVISSIRGANRVYLTSRFFPSHAQPTAAPPGLSTGKGKSLARLSAGSQNGLDYDGRALRADSGYVAGQTSP